VSLGQDVSEAPQQHRPVGQIRQRVVVRQVGELVLQRAPIGDVAPVPHEADVGVVDQVLAHGLHGPDAPVAGAQPQLDRQHEAGLLGEPVIDVATAPRSCGSTWTSNGRSRKSSGGYPTSASTAGLT
jgi:hypothetical protein